MRPSAFERHGGQRSDHPPGSRRQHRTHSHPAPSRPHARKQVALEASANGSRSASAARRPPSRSLSRSNRCIRAPSKPDIFLPVTPAPDKLELTLARIRGIVGENNVGIPQLLNTHHPHPFQLADAATANCQHPTPNTQPPRLFVSSALPSPPLSRSITTARPASLPRAFTEKYSTPPDPGEPRAIGGPQQPGIATNGTSRSTNGSLYRIYSDPHWFIEGSYD